jgi:AcrR family transcriptional regulator
MSTAGISPPKLGLRERKKLKTRESIQREAMRLFKRNGYEETTIEQIAAAADISPGTYFNYFPTKEDVVLYDAFDPIIGDLLSSRPPDEPLGVSFRHVLDLISQLLERDRESVYERSKLSLEVPELRARLWEEFEKAQGFMGGLIAQRSGRSQDDFEIRVVVMALVASMMEAMREWVRLDGQTSLGSLLQRAFDVVDGAGRLDAITNRNC